MLLSPLAFFSAAYDCVGPKAGRPRGVPETTITAYRDGPLLVRGSFQILDQNGEEIERDGETIALCRCGKSRMRPFCDGTHALVRFQCPSHAERGRKA